MTPRQAATRRFELSDTARKAPARRASTPALLAIKERRGTAKQTEICGKNIAVQGSGFIMLRGRIKKIRVARRLFGLLTGVIQTAEAA